MANWKRVLTEDDYVGDSSLSAADQTISVAREVSGVGSLYFDLGGGVDINDNLKISAPSAGGGSITLESNDDTNETITLKALSVTTDFTLNLPSDGVETQNVLMFGVGNSTTSSLTFKRIHELNDLSGVASTAGHDSIPSYLADDAQVTPDFIVDIDTDPIPGTQYKLSLDDIAGALLLGMINSNVANGYGTDETYIDVGADNNTGLSGDLNGDGSVTAADLLQFLGQFGLIDTDDPDSADNYSPRYVTINNVATQDVSSVDFSSDHKELLGWTNADISSNTGQLDIGINDTSKFFTIESNQYFDMSAIPAKKLRFSHGDATETGVTVYPNMVGGVIRLWAKIRLFNSSDLQLGTTGYFELSTFVNNTTLPADGAVKVYINNSPNGVRTITSEQLYNETGIYYSNTSLDKIEVSYYVSSSVSDLDDVKIDNLVARLNAS
jgi:hypothetical protein